MNQWILGPVNTGLSKQVEDIHYRVIDVIFINELCDFLHWFNCALVLSMLFIAKGIKIFSTDPSWKIKMKRGFLHVVPSTKINHSQSKKEMANFICANLRLIIRRQSFRKFWGPFQLLEVKAQLRECLRQRAIHQSNILTVRTVLQGEWWVLVTPYKTEKGTLSPKELPCWCQEEIAFVFVE